MFVMMDSYHGGSLFAMATRGEAHLPQVVGTLT